MGPDGGTGHPDHRLVSSIVTQLARAGAPGVSERLFYANIPADGFQVVNQARGAPPFLVPLAKHFTVRVPVAAAHLDAARRSIMCHRTQYPDDVATRLSDWMRQTLIGGLSLIPAFPASAGTELLPP